MIVLLICYWILFKFEFGISNIIEPLLSIPNIHGPQFKGREVLQKCIIVIPFSVTVVWREPIDCHVLPRNRYQCGCRRAVSAVWTYNCWTKRKSLLIDYHVVFRAWNWYQSGRRSICQWCPRIKLNDWRGRAIIHCRSRDNLLVDCHVRSFESGIDISLVAEVSVSDVRKSWVIIVSSISHWMSPKCECDHVSRITVFISSANFGPVSCPVIGSECLCDLSPR